MARFGVEFSFGVNGAVGDPLLSAYHRGLAFEVAVGHRREFTRHVMGRCSTLGIPRLEPKGILCSVGAAGPDLELAIFCGTRLLRKSGRQGTTSLSLSGPCLHP